MKEFSISKITKFTSWDNIVKLNDFSYPWLKEKAPVTTFSAYYDESHIHFLFVASGPKPIVFVEDNNKMEVINSERVEIFFRKDEKMQPYYCLELDPYGRVLDYKAKLYRNFDLNWEWPEPLFIQTKITIKNYSLQGKISLHNLIKLGLLKNNEIQLGLFRGHCIELKEKKASIKWISWVDSKTEEPDFHVPSAFGLLLLENYTEMKTNNN